MRADTAKLLRSHYREKIDRFIWEYAQAEIDFSRAPDYDTPLHSAYDPDFIPLYKEPSEAITDPTVSEIWVLKCSRAGASENLHFNSIRYHIEEDPLLMQYISGDQVSVERGMKLSPGLQRKYRKAHALEHQIYFDDCSLVVTWPKNKMAFKQSGYGLILADEFSTWPGYSGDMMRRRVETYDFSHIVGISSPDPQQKRPSEEDPIFIEFDATDKRYWFMPDPGGSKRKKQSFRFELGGPDLGYGLKWDPTARDEDGEWNLARVRETAYYLTPCGARIEEKDRLNLVDKGRWIATREGAQAGIRGYHVNCFYLPFSSSSFGAIAVAFLKAQGRGKAALRVFIYEWLAEKWYDEKEQSSDEQVYARQRVYKKGQSYAEAKKYKDIYIGKELTRFLTCDVQKGHLWTVCREWIEGGDSGLLDWRYLPDFPDLAEMSEEFGVHKNYIDVGYRLRQMEVYDFCYQYDGSYPTVGSPNLTLPYKLRDVDPFEGRVGAGKNSMFEYTFNADIMKSLTLNLLNGEGDKSWNVYKSIERQYVSGVASEARVNGVWETIKGHQNHLWDCEVLQVLAATIEGIYLSDWVVPQKD